MRWSTLILVLLAACEPHESPDPAVELGVPIDLGVDLSAPGSLATSCAGTPIEGTCVERFFAPFMACFAPAGRCGTFGRGSVCWESGARYELAYPGLSSTWSMKGNRCLSWVEYTEVPVPREQYCTSESSPCSIERSVDDGGLSSYRAVGGALYEPGTGVFTCPDGTQVKLGGNFGGCPALSALMGQGCERSEWNCL